MLLAGTAAVLIACSNDEPAPEVAETAATATAAAVEKITEDYIREVMIEISDDDYEGRGPATAGDLKTRKFLVEQMKEIGLQPGMPDGTWEQPFKMVSVNTLPTEGWTFQRNGKSVTFEFYEDFMINGDNQQPQPSVENAEVVFAGYGIQAPEFGWDDYKNIDVTGKVVLLMNNDPDWDPDLFAGEARGRGQTLEELFIGLVGGDAQPQADLDWF
jgi:hypothetical protein